MLARWRTLWADVRDSLWFVPGVLTVLAFGLAFVVIEIDRRAALDSALFRTWIFTGGVEGARGVLTAIAGGLITVTGVVFSVTIVALQLASSQFTPRVLRNFTADRGNQTVLGVFIATFTYTLLVLRTIRSGDEGEAAFIPRLGVAVAVALVLVSIGFLIYFINHSARSIQISLILDRVAERTLENVYRLFPEHIGHADEAVPDDPRRPDRSSVHVAADAAGYLQAVDGTSLFRLGGRKNVIIAMEPHIGEFLLPGQPLASVAPPNDADDEVVDGIHTAFVLGPERTPDQDLEFGIIEISDIAVKALSPSINDPTTAFRCIDRLSEILLVLGTRDPPRNERTDEGRVHYIGRHTEFERAVGLAFDQIRHFGAGNPAVAKKLVETLIRMEPLVPARRRPPLTEQRKAVLQDAGTQVENPADLASIERAAERMQVQNE